MNFDTNQAFDNTLVDQDLDMFTMGWVEGFNGAPAGFRHTTVTRQNMTICDSTSFVEGTCSLGHERFVCYDSFSICSGGDCDTINRKLLSPPSDYFARFSTTGLNGTYDLQARRTSPACAQAAAGGRQNTPPLTL
jgi:hypothetical protein